MVNPGDFWCRNMEKMLETSKLNANFLKGWDFFQILINYEITFLYGGSLPNHFKVEDTIP